MYLKCRVDHKKFTQYTIYKKMSYWHDTVYLETVVLHLAFSKTFQHISGFTWLLWRWLQCRHKT